MDAKSLKAYMKQIPESEYSDAAKDAAGNHLRFNSFAWFAAPEDSENWTIVYTSNRDSTLLDKSNAEVIDRFMSKFPESMVRSESHSHWAVGHVDGYAIRVYTKRKTITQAFRTYFALQHYMREVYPVLDDTHYSNLEYEQTLENIGFAGKRFIKNPEPEGWESKVVDWLDKNESSQMESHDDMGASPSEDSLKRALTALGMIDTEYLDAESEGS